MSRFETLAVSKVPTCLKRRLEKREEGVGGRGECRQFSRKTDKDKFVNSRFEFSAMAFTTFI